MPGRHHPHPRVKCSLCPRLPSSLYVFPPSFCGYQTPLTPGCWVLLTLPSRCLHCRFPHVFLPALYESDLSLLPQQFLFKTCLLSPMVFISSLDIVGILYRTCKHLTVILSLTIPVPQILGGSVGFCWFSDSWCLVSLCVEWTSGATSCTVGLNLWPG